MLLLFWRDLTLDRANADGTGTALAQVGRLMPFSPDSHGLGAVDSGVMVLVGLRAHADGISEEDLDLHVLLGLRAHAEGWADHLVKLRVSTFNLKMVADGQGSSQVLQLTLDQAFRPFANGHTSISSWLALVLGLQGESSGQAGDLLQLALEQQWSMGADGYGSTDADVGIVLVFGALSAGEAETLAQRLGFPRIAIVEIEVLEPKLALSASEVV